MLFDQYLAGVMKLVNIGDLKGPDAKFVTPTYRVRKGNNGKVLGVVPEAARRGQQPPLFLGNCDRICGAVAGLRMVLSQLIWSP